MNSQTHILRSRNTLFEGLRAVQAGGEAVLVIGDDRIRFRPPNFDLDVGTTFKGVVLSQRAGGVTLADVTATPTRVQIREEGAQGTRYADWTAVLAVEVERHPR